MRKGRMEPPFYGSLQRYFEERGERDFSPGRVRQAVRAIRREKLPDPARVANAGSFFKNPIVAEAVARRLGEAYPEMPRFAGGEGRVKLAAGWLIERAGLKGHAGHGFATSKDNALVVINESGRSYAQLEAFAGEIVAKVQERFGVRLEQEPETL